VDIKEPIKLDEEKRPLKLAEILRSDKKSFIRTMEKDLAVLKKKGPPKPGRPMAGLIRKEPPKGAVPPSPAEPFKKAVPPAGLPVSGPTEKPSMPSPPPVARPTPPVGPPKSAERLKKEEEIKKRIEETRKRIEEARRKAEVARQKATREKAEKEKKGEEVKGKTEKLQKPRVVEKKKPLLRFVFIGLAAVVVIGGLGGFIYWWNYLRVPPAFHYECQEFQCVSVEGEGEDQCQTDVDCQPVEPTVPASLMPVDETKTIELAAGQEDLLVEILKTAASQAQATSTFKQILVKLVSQTEKKYADLDTLLTTLGVGLPDDILTAVATSEVEGDNYTLFLYNQAEGNRLGLVIEMAESETLVTDLTNWETTMVEDLSPLFLENGVPAAFTEEFQDNAYQGIAIRYLNFPDPGLSIDYGIVAGKLVLTTSRASMYATIDALLAAESEPEGEAGLQQNLNSLFGLDRKEADTEIYYSDKLGVGFTYVPSQGQAGIDSTVTVTEIGDKIYVHGANGEPEQGQSIEVFTKDSNLTLGEAIEARFLGGYDPNDCFVKNYGTNETRLENYVSAGISFPPSSDPDAPWWQNADKCPQHYSESNGIQYFLMNEDVPGKFLFVEIGQDSIASDGTPITTEGGFNWSHSIRILE